MAAERATGAVGGDRGREGDRPDRRRRSTERDRARRSLEPSPGMFTRCIFNVEYIFSLYIEFYSSEQHKNSKRKRTIRRCGYSMIYLERLKRRRASTGYLLLRSK